MANSSRELREPIPSSDYMSSFVNNNNNDENTEEEYWRSCAMQLASSSVVSSVMQAVVDLGVLEIISKAGEGGGVSADKIASQLKLTNDATVATASSMLDRMLCLLVSHSVLTCTNTTTTKRRFYGLSPIAKHFIPNSDGISLGPYMSLVQDKVFMDNWTELKPAVLEGGIPFKRVHGMHAFDYMGKDSRFSEVFNKAMINHTIIVINKILHSYKGFEQLRRLVDVGGGLGVALNLITSKYPHIKGVNFDLPHVILQAPLYPGVEHVAGDMFEGVPMGDAIFMKWILHDWNDEHCLKLLKNCHKALSDKGKLIIVEGIVPLIPDSTSPADKDICQLDLIMMTQTPNGKERTRQEFLSLATAAGFAGIRLECSVYNFWVMEFFK